MPVLVVQLGHCYRRTGATGTAGEQDFATRVGAACAALLHGRGGWQVRQILADTTSSAYKGDAFVAIHCDGSTNSGARGASVGYRTPEGQAFGQAWKRAYADRGWPGFRPDNYTSALAQYYGTGTAVAQGNRRAAIVECGFLTNPDDRSLLTRADGANRVALAIGSALGIQQEEDMPLTRDDVVLIREMIRNEVLAAGDWRFGGRNVMDMLVQTTSSVLDIQGQEAAQTAILTALSDDEANIIAAVRAVETGQVDVNALAAALGPMLARVPEDQVAHLVSAIPQATRELLAAALAGGN